MSTDFATIICRLSLRKKQFDEKDWDTFEDESGAKDMKVKSVEFNSIGDATNIE